MILRSTPWDSRALGCETFEMIDPTAEELLSTKDLLGHCTVKINPLANKRLLHELGFYYCDTLVQPYVSKESFTGACDEHATISTNCDLEHMLHLASSAFEYDRFHRDFNLTAESASLRYQNWLRELYDGGQVLVLKYKDEFAGFFAHEGNHIVLHALSPKYKGRGLSKFFWTVAIESMFHQGYTEIDSSISFANIPVTNLYVSLGFKFRNAKDVYHRINR